MIKAQSRTINEQAAKIKTLIASIGLLQNTTRNQSDRVETHHKKICTSESELQQLASCTPDDSNSPPLVKNNRMRKLSIFDVFSIACTLSKCLDISKMNVYLLSTDQCFIQQMALITMDRRRSP